MPRVTRDPASEVERKPWEQQPGEGSKAFEVFAMFRDAGPRRSLVAIAKQLRRDKTVYWDWSKKHKWVARAEAWDRHLDDIARERLEEERRTMADRHARIASLMIARVAAQLMNMEDNDKTKPLTPAMIEKWFATAAGIERLSRGEATERVDHMAPIPVATFNYDTAIGPVLDDETLASRLEAEE